MRQIDEMRASARRLPIQQEKVGAAAGAEACRDESLSGRGWTKYCRIATALAAQHSADLL